MKTNDFRVHNYFSDSSVFPGYNYLGMGITAAAGLTCAMSKRPSFLIYATGLITKNGLSYLAHKKEWTNSTQKLFTFQLILSGITLVAAHVALSILKIGNQKALLLSAAVPLVADSLTLFFTESSKYFSPFDRSYYETKAAAYKAHSSANNDQIFFFGKQYFLNGEAFEASYTIPSELDGWKAYSLLNVDRVICGHSLYFAGGVGFDAEQDAWRKLSELQSDKIHTYTKDEMTLYFLGGDSYQTQQAVLCALSLRRKDLGALPGRMVLDGSGYYLNGTRYQCREPMENEEQAWKDYSKRNLGVFTQTINSTPCAFYNGERYSSAEDAWKALSSDQNSQIHEFEGCFFFDGKKYETKLAACISESLKKPKTVLNYKIGSRMQHFADGKAFDVIESAFKHLSNAHPQEIFEANIQGVLGFYYKGARFPAINSVWYQITKTNPDGITRCRYSNSEYYVCKNSPFDSISEATRNFPEKIFHYNDSYYHNGLSHSTMHAAEIERSKLYPQLIFELISEGAPLYYVNGHTFRKIRAASLLFAEAALIRTTDPQRRIWICGDEITPNIPPLTYYYLRISSPYPILPEIDWLDGELHLFFAGSCRKIASSVAKLASSPAA